MLKRYRFLLIIVALVTLFLITVIWYIHFIENKRENLQNDKYKVIVKKMQEELAANILAKQKATLAMAISLADYDLVEDLVNKRVDKDHYSDLIAKFKKDTLYKNIWIHIVDKDMNSIYRSWDDVKSENIAELRPDLVAIMKTKKVAHICSSGQYDLSIKAVVPLIKDDKVIGLLELVSHFNSISKQLKKFDTDSVVVLNKEQSKRLKKPFTKLFINNEYYVANFDAPPKHLKYLSDRGVENYFNNSYKVDNDYLVVSYPIKGIDSKPVGYYIMFKKRDSVSSIDLDFFMFRWFTFGTFLFMTISVIGAVSLFYINRKEKQYYKNIIDSSTNMVVINDKHSTVTVNRIFFKYFDRYSSMDEFKKKHKCMCEFFHKEDGYLQKVMDGVNWVDYLLANRDKENKVKIKYYEKEYYFSVNASLVSEEKDHYSLVFSDITKQENYKNELEHLTVTDSLTGIKNRRYFTQRLDEEISKAKRYRHGLSLVMFDIDYFKKVNDVHGHAVGDNVLVEYSKFISSLIRDVDVLCRIGGEEFMIILPHSNKKNAAHIAEKLRIKIQEYKKILPITMSFGVTQYVDGEDVEFIYKRVDDALYKAKETGRNRVVVG